MLRPSISNDSLLLAVVRSGSDFFDEYLDYFRQIRELRSRRPFYFGLMHSLAARLRKHAKNTYGFAETATSIIIEMNG